MAKPEDWRDSRTDADDPGGPEDDFTAAVEHAPGSDAPRSTWQRLRRWLFNIIPVVLSLASAYLMLVLLAKLTGLG